jgi:glucoamylase
VLATLNRLEAMFEQHFPVNRCRPEGRGLALGRYKADQYQGGNPWYNTTLAAAEFYYQRNYVEHGDAVMRMVRNTVPSDGSLSEQFDKSSGQPCSARHLSWSYAAFITAAHARRQATINAFAPEKVLKYD